MTGLEPSPPRQGGVTRTSHLRPAESSRRHGGLTRLIVPDHSHFRDWVFSTQQIPVMLYPNLIARRTVR